MLSNAWKTDNFKLVQKAFKYEYSKNMSELKLMLGEFSANAVDYAMQGLGGYGEYQEYNGSTLNQATERRGFLTVLTPKEYNLTVDITRKMAKIDKEGEIARTGAKLARGGFMSVYLKALRMFSAAYTGDILGGDGKAWAATDHPVASKGSENRTSIVDSDAGTFSNLIADKLSVAAITKAQTMARNMVTPDGLPTMVKLDTILVSAENEAIAKKLFGVDNKWTPVNDPESAENGANPVSGLRYVVVSDGGVGLTDYQWAICDRRLMQETAGIVYNEKPTVLRTELDNPLIDRYVGYMDYTVGFGDARPIIFSNGSGS